MRVSNIASRNVFLMLASASFAGMVYCIYDTVKEGRSWIGLCPIITATALLFRYYLSYRKAVKSGNLYGKVSPFTR